MQRPLAKMVHQQLHRWSLWSALLLGMLAACTTYMQWRSYVNETTHFFSDAIADVLQNNWVQGTPERVPQELRFLLQHRVVWGWQIIDLRTNAVVYMEGIPSRHYIRALVSEFSAPVTVTLPDLATYRLVMWADMKAPLRRGAVAMGIAFGFAYVCGLALTRFLRHKLRRDVMDPIAFMKAHFAHSGDDPQAIGPMPREQDLPIEFGLLRDQIDQSVRVAGESRDRMLTMERAAAVGRMARQVAHDIRSPLTSIQTAARMFEHRQAAGTKSVEIAVQLLQLGSKRLAQIADDLLSDRAGKPFGSVDAVIDLHAVCDDLVNELSNQPLGAGVDFVRAYFPERQSVVGDSVRLQRALGNLIKNGLEAMQDNPACRPRRMRISTTNEGQYTKLVLADTGAGMSAEVISRVLQGGFTSGKADGHGIGMQVVREVVTDLRGELQCTSAVGHGTTFTLLIPRHVIFQTDAADATTASATEAAPTAAPTILVLDDDDGIRLAWQLEQPRLGIGTLHAHASMEACVASAPDFAQIDCAFVDKHIKGSDWTLEATIRHLKTGGVKKVVVASGESAKDLAADPVCALADGILPDKIPESLKEYVVGAASAVEV